MSTKNFHLVEVKNPDNIPYENGVQICHGGGVVLEKWLDRSTSTCRMPLSGVWAAAKRNCDPGPNWTTYQFKLIHSYDTYEDAENMWAAHWIARDGDCPIYVM